MQLPANQWVVGQDHRECMLPPYAGDPRNCLLLPFSLILEVHTLCVFDCPEGWMAEGKSTLHGSREARGLQPSVVIPWFQPLC